ncbi:MAG: YdcH family protein [Thiomonas sp.]|nr:YdcH family protein [Thiomonas sp.]
MTLDPHDLTHDFPAQADKIHALKSGNGHFQKLAQRYEEINKDVMQIEEGVRAADDAHLESLKKERLLLKDQLAALLAA